MRGKTDFVSSGSFVLTSIQYPGAFSWHCSDMESVSFAPLDLPDYRRCAVKACFFRCFIDSCVVTVPPLALQCEPDAPLQYCNIVYVRLLGHNSH